MPAVTASIARIGSALPLPNTSVMWKISKVSKVNSVAATAMRMCVRSPAEALTSRS
jgi:hypothetical protein